MLSSAEYLSTQVLRRWGHKSKSREEVGSHCVNDFSEDFKRTDRGTLPPVRPSVFVLENNRLKRVLSMAPTLLSWIYSGGKDGSPEADRRGEQLAYAGDDVMDDKGVIMRVDRGDVVVEFCNVLNEV